MPAKALTDLLSTGQAASILKVAPRTITKWFAAGWLKGHFIENGSTHQHRRIRLDSLVDFMVSHNMPLTMLDGSGLPMELIEREKTRIANRG